MTEEDIIRQRMHGLYLTRACEDLSELSRNLLGMHGWFCRNVLFSGLIRGADISGWKTELTKTWLYRGTLHGVAYDDLPGLLALHPVEEPLSEFEQHVLRLMEDGIYSRAEFRRIFADEYDDDFIKRAFSPWGGVFVGLARRGLVAFRDMTSRDFDLLDAEPTLSRDEAFARILPRYFAAYGPATLADAAWFLGLKNSETKYLRGLLSGDIERTECGKNEYFYINSKYGMADIPEVVLLSGFDPIIESYADRTAILPRIYKSRVILSSGICLPAVAVNGRIAGLWNIKNGKPLLEMFDTQPKRIESTAKDMVERIYWEARRF